VYTSRGETCRTEVYPEKGYVIKYFLPRKPKYGKPVSDLRQSLDLCLYREVECLNRLTDSRHFPKIITYNPGELWIKMTYVGEHLINSNYPNQDELLDQVPGIVEDLSRANIKLAYEWTPGDGKIGYCHSMMMLKGHVLSLIDFERAWPVGCKRENEFNSVFIDSFFIHSDSKLKHALEQSISILYEKK
jgi:hypothetical protein